MGQKGLEKNTIEYAIAKKFYHKKDGNSASRRISVISNILIASDICKSKNACLTLKS